jgi:hypothetical protein
MPRAKCAMLTQDWFWTLASAAASREAELKVLTRTQRASSAAGIGAQDAVAAVTLDFHPSLHLPQKLGLKPKTKVNHPVMVATWKQGSRLHRHPSRVFCRSRPGAGRSARDRCWFYPLVVLWEGT